MTFSLEYHNVVECPPRRSIPASLALFWMLLVPLAPNSLAQINSASATSSSSGHAATAAPASVTSIGHGGYAPSSSGPSTLANLPHSPGGANINNNENHPHRTANGTAYYPYIYAVPWPYAVDLGNADTSDGNDDDADYQGGPTIFDRRGSGRDSYVPPSYAGPAHAQDAPAEGASGADSASEPPPRPTTLVFQDGHQLEVDNYAIVSQTLYDLTPGHPRKIALADLDLAATEKQNDEHGICFQLPPSPQAN